MKMAHKIILWIICLNFVACLDIGFLKEDPQTTSIRPFYRDNYTLKKLVETNNTFLENLIFRSPSKYTNGNQETLSDICLLDGSIDRENISHDINFQNEVYPFFEMYCSTKANSTIGIKRYSALLAAFSCTAEVAGIFAEEMPGPKVNKTITFENEGLKKCFDTPFLINWFNTYLFSESSKELKISLSKLPNRALDKFNWHLVFNANSFNGEIYFRLGEEINGGLFILNTKYNKVLFGLSGNFNLNNGVVNYDLQHTEEIFKQELSKVVNAVNRHRAVIHFQNYGKYSAPIDMDFWSLHGEESHFRFSQVNGGREFGLMGVEKKYSVENSTITEIPSPKEACLTLQQCYKQKFKLMPKERIVELGLIDSVKKAYDNIVNDQRLILLTQANYRNFPNYSFPSWEILEGGISKIYRSFFSILDDNQYFYLYGGQTLENSEIVPASNIVRIQKETLLKDVISAGEMPVSAPTLSRPAAFVKSGVIDNDEIWFEFGGIDDSGIIVNRGSLYLKKADKYLNIDFSEFHERYSPIVIHTGQFIIVYGGLYLDDNYKIAYIRDGFIIDLINEITFPMNMDYSPNWISSVVWTGEYLFAWGGFEVDFSEIYPSVRGHSYGAIFDLNTNSWSSVPLSPLEGRMGHGLIYHNDKIIAVGGQSIVTNFDERPPIIFGNSGAYTPGMLNKIYFTDKYLVEPIDGLVVTDEVEGEIYLDGYFVAQKNIGLFIGPNCDPANGGRLNILKREKIGINKIKLTFDLLFEDNVVSVLVSDDKLQQCTNAISFLKI